MKPEQIRSTLSSIAEQAGTHGVSSADVIKQSSKRRKRRAVAIVSTLAMGALGTLAGTYFMTSDGKGELASSPEEPLIICGQGFPYQGKDSTVDGVTIEFSSVRKVNEKSGPDIQVAVKSDRRRALISTPPESVRVIYLKDGIVVGGGPALNKPGDLTPQPEFLVGHQIEAGPGNPSVLELGRRDTLCASANWSRIWQEPAAYEIAVLMFPPAEGGTKIPDLGSGHLMIRAKLAP